MALREVFAKARTHNQAELASADLQAWLSWAQRSRLASFKRLATTLKTHFDAVVRGMLDNRSNAFIEAMNGLMQQAKRAARGFRTATHFINVAYLRLSKLTHLPQSAFASALPLSAGMTAHRMESQVPHRTTCSRWRCRLMGSPTCMPTVNAGFNELMGS